MDKNQIWIALGTTIGGALLAWVGMAARKAIKNYGKTDVEIAQADLDDKTKKYEDALKTADPCDDVAAAKAKAVAEEHLAFAKRVQAITDAIGDTNTPNEQK